MEKTQTSKIRNVSLILASIGLIDALYLTIIKLTNHSPFCVQGLGSCGAVTSSKYSEIYGIPISLFGMLAYLSIILTVIFIGRINILKEYGKYLLFGITLLGFLFSIYLTYLQAGVIHAFCPYCLLSALIMTSLFVLSIIKL